MIDASKIRRRAVKSPAPIRNKKAAIQNKGFARSIQTALTRGYRNAVIPSLMRANLITLAHLSVSSTIILPTAVAAARQLDRFV